MSLTLYHLYTSPFAEKARWALDLKGLPYRSEVLIPGRHADSVEKISGTRTVPMLVDTAADAPITDSTDILRHLDEVAPDPVLYPARGDEVAEIEDWLDEEIAQACARLNYSYLSEHPRAFLAYFSNGLSRGQRMQTFLIRPRLPAIIARFREERELSREAAAGYRARVEAGFDRVETLLERGEGRYLIGDSFTAADLTAACMLAMALRLPGTPWEVTAEERKVYPSGNEATELLDARAALAARPAADWVAAIWRRHR